MSNVSRGRVLEWKARDLFIQAGYYVIRSAGSKGLADLIALAPGKVVLIQCKRGSARQSPVEANQFKSLSRWLNADGVLYSHPKHGKYLLTSALSRGPYIIQDSTALALTKDSASCLNSPESSGPC